MAERRGGYGHEREWVEWVGNVGRDRRDEREKKEKRKIKYNNNKIINKIIKINN